MMFGEPGTEQAKWSAPIVTVGVRVGADGQAEDIN